MTRLSSRAVAVGYAVPGPVVGIGVLLAMVAADDALEAIGLDLPGVVATGSLLVLAYAYAIRFLAPGLGAIESGIGPLTLIVALFRPATSPSVSSSSSGLKSLRSA